MAVKLSSLKANREKERDGDWIPAPDIDPSVSFFVRSTNYAPFKIERDARWAKLARKFGDDPIPDDDQAKLLGELAVKHLLMDWKGFVDDDKAPIEFTQDIASEILTDEAYRAVRGAVYYAATKVGKFEIEVVEGGAKN